MRASYPHNVRGLDDALVVAVKSTKTGFVELTPQVEAALLEAKGVVGRAGELLGIGRSRCYRLKTKYGIPRHFGKVGMTSEAEVAV